MPPICVVGLCLSQDKFFFAKGAFLLYLTNLLGITLACMIIFIVAGYTKVNRALGWTVALTGLMLLPLGASFIQLVRHAHLEAEITNKLINETITVGEGVDSTEIKVDWTKDPAIIYVILQTEKEIYSNQVALVEEFIERKMKQHFEMIFIVSEIKHITGNDALVEKDKTEKVIPEFELSSKSKLFILQENTLEIEENQPKEEVQNNNKITIVSNMVIRQPESFLNQTNYSILQDKTIIRRSVSNPAKIKLKKPAKKKN